eukprot:GDKJ01013667.1.p1 GENE.GDKJ01013667.1~~GDKJ01013667.1.p1  ORF type:complete len:256 (-),score=66.81 GDKJ01013667.1:108-761(-)
MKLNRLTSTDIWMKNTLKVPAPTKPVETWDPNVEENFKKIQQVTAFSSAAQISPSVAKELLEEKNYEGDTHAILLEMKTIKRLARDCGVSDHEAKAYFLLGDRHYDKAKQLFLDDKKWEADGKGKAAAYKKLTSMSEVMPILLGAPTDDEDMKNLLEDANFFDENEGLRSRKVLYEGPAIRIPATSYEATNSKNEKKNEKNLKNTQGVREFVNTTLI